MFIKRRCKEQKSAANILIFLALGLEDFHDDLLFLDQESADDLFPDSLVAQDSSVSPEDSLLASGQTSLLLVPGNIEDIKTGGNKQSIFSYVAGLTPFSFRPVMGHLGTEGLFFRYWKTSFPPGVLTFFTRLDLVL